MLVQRLLYPGTAAHELKQAQSAEVKLSHEGLCLHHHR